jgi:hypothetical protein
MKLTDRQLRNFWKKVSKIPGGCWEWTAGRDRDGYGRFWVYGITSYSHRVSFMIHHGHLPGNCIMHTCDNPACVNPDHLRPGTHTDNMKDMKEKGRSKIGHPKKRLSAEARNAIASDLALPGNRIRTLAKKYRVDPALLRRYRSKLKTQ